MKTLIMDNLDELPYGAQEALNRLRVNFGFCGKEYKKVLITSSVPDEGKSFVSVRLWKMLAEAGNSVVLVDADIRKSVIRSRHKMGTDGQIWSLAHYLSGQAEMEDIVYATNVRNGYMVPTLYTVSNPAILLQNGRFEMLLNWLAEQCDYVIVDTPPLSNVSDGELIASLCDGALLVVRSGVTPRSLVAASIKQLERANCKLMGTVLNGVQKQNSQYYYRYGKYGKYGYGKYGYGYGKDSGESGSPAAEAAPKSGSGRSEKPTDSGKTAGKPAGKAGSAANSGSTAASSKTGRYAKADKAAK